VLVGEAGTGKTTLLHAAIESEPCRNVSCVYLNNPALTRGEFVEILSHRFGLSPRAGESKAVLLDELDQVLRARRAQGQITALVIDEAQSLSDELLEEIRLLANIETTTEKLLPLVLTGQPELKDRLNDPGLRQLKQRITLRCEIVPFGQDETAAYIAMRIRTAGGDAAKLFTREAVMLIHERSGGIPRSISVMCDNALLTGCGLGRQPVDCEIVQEVATDFDLGERQTSGQAAKRTVVVAAPAVQLASGSAQAPETTAFEREGQQVLATTRGGELFAGIAKPRRFSLFRGWSRAERTT
jgi:type II secretory pathway predicted ATPase ExeA